VTWFALRVTAGVQREAVIATLLEGGAPGLQEDGPSLVTHYRSASEAQRAADEVRVVEPGARCEIGVVPEVDWVHGWRDQQRLYRAGGVIVAPPWLAAGLPPRGVVVIDPGMAFGTGAHASTRGALRLLDRAVRPGADVADLGTGSGILAIAAARLGAARVFAIEHDPEALPNAQENIARNAVGDVVELLEGDAGALLRLVAPVTLIVANILASVHDALLPAMGSALRPGGSAILAGLLTGERDPFTRNAQRAGWRVAEDDTEGDWWAARLVRS
jgi:ribosomal protein L11 methyltransferase